MQLWSRPVVPDLVPCKIKLQTQSRIPGAPSKASTLGVSTRHPGGVGKLHGARSPGIIHLPAHLYVRGEHQWLPSDLPTNFYFLV